jgi:hypothetical protein
MPSAQLTAVYLVITIFVLPLVFYFIHRHFLPKAIPGIAHNLSSTNTIWGDVPALLSHIKQHQTASTFGTTQHASLNSPLIQLFVRPFRKSTVFLSDYREIRDILTKRHAKGEFDRSRTFYDWFSGTVPGHSIIMPTTDKFKKQSQLLAETMSTKFLHDVASDHLYIGARNLVELWERKRVLSSGMAFEAADDVTSLAME